MNTATSPIDHSAPYAREVREGNWFQRAESWLDERGKGAWIVAMVAGFIFIWPVGLALLAYMIWSKRMFSGNCSKRTHSHRSSWKAAMKSSGNAAFDAYKADTLSRLESEQDQFEAFLQRLRDAKDKAEFDEFMNERANDVSDEADEDDGDTAKS